jgi:hypothetical protein
MRYIIDLSPALAEGVNEKVQLGKYKSPQEFIVTSIQNQLYIESQELEIAPTTDSSTLSTSATTAPASQMKTVAIPNLLSRDIEGVKTVKLGALERPSSLWGQYNRLFPVKIVTRVAANLAKQYDTNYLALWELQDKAAEMARDLGKVIERKDRQLGKKRGTIMSAGLPVGRDKATLRFKSQFVGYVTGTKIEGAAPTLKLLDMISDEKNAVRVGLTQAGAKFASLVNPVIDAHDFSTPLSNEEIDFLLDHIASEVPGEAKLIQLILNNVKKGIATPEKLNDKVKALHPDRSTNENVMMRAGVVSRICELGLLDRDKDGVKVTYVLTDKGEKYLKRLTASEA